MTPTAPIIRKPGNPATQFPLLCAAAAQIGMNRRSLYRILKNQRRDCGNYIARYRAFVRQHG
jgi:hypothetical protein